jgi:hypothetical protein
MLLNYNFSSKCHFQLQNIFHDFSWLQNKKINKNKLRMKHSQTQLPDDTFMMIILLIELKTIFNFK